MQYPTEMTIEITRTVDANVKNGISILDSIDTAHEIAHKHGFHEIGMGELIQFVRTCYAQEIGAEACALINQEVSQTVKRGEDKVSAILNALECCLEHGFAWTRIMHYYTIDVYYDYAYDKAFDSWCAKNSLNTIQ